MTKDNQTDQPKDLRRHDLDALRAFAMLLGIILHAALAYTALPWIVQDPSKWTGFDRLFEFIHIFRMPLFFLLSGFFTAMLFTRRGARGLLVHRAKRIGIPLLVSAATIIPITAWSIRYANAPQDEQIIAEETETLDIWRAAAEGNIPQLSARIEEGADPNAGDAAFGSPPLAYAAIGNQPESVRVLLEAGADPNNKFGDGGTALHTAMFLGRAEISETLLDAGADLEAQNMRNETPTDSLAVNEQITMMIAGFLRLEDTFESIDSGRNDIRAMLEKRGKPVVPPTITERLQGLVTILIAMPIFYHLWFLWHLCWLILAFLIIGTTTRRLAFITRAKPIAAFPWCLIFLIPITAWTQSLMREGGMGPDTAIGLIPAPHVLLHYAVFFFSGAALYASKGSRLRAGWIGLLALPVGIGLYPVALRMRGALGEDEQFGFGFMLIQSAIVWLVTYGLIALFERVSSGERRWVRFLSDSSYWLYLAHLPLVVVAQVWVRDLDAPAWLKFVLVTVPVTLVLLVSYRYLVRYSVIGTMLNGKRSRSYAASPKVNA